MGWLRKASYQNNVEEIISYHHSQKNWFPIHPSSCVHSQTVAVCSCSYPAKSRTKYYYLYIKKHCISTSSKEEVGVFVNISCLIQRKHKNVLQFKQMLQFSLHCMVSLHRKMLGNMSDCTKLSLLQIMNQNE